MMTSWPGPTWSARNASASAALAELTTAAAATPRNWTRSCSSPATSGPCASCPPRTTRATRSASSPLRVGRECGIIVKSRERSGATEPPDSVSGHPSEIQEQADRLEGLRVFDASLNAAEVRARPSQLQNGQVLDVRLRHLRSMRLETGQLRLEHVGDVRRAVRSEVHGRRDLEEEEIWHVAGRRHRA